MEENKRDNFLRQPFAAPPSPRRVIIFAIGSLAALALLWLLAPFLADGAITVGRVFLVLMLTL